MKYYSVRKVVVDESKNLLYVSLYIFICLFIYYIIHKYNIYNPVYM